MENRQLFYEMSLVLNYLKGLKKNLSVETYLKRAPGKFQFSRSHAKEVLDALLERKFLCLEDDETICFPQEPLILTGIVKLIKAGFGVVQFDSEMPEFVFNSYEVKKYLTGDKLRIKCQGMNEDGKITGSVIEFLSRSNTSVIGTLHKRSKKLDLEPEDPTLKDRVFQLSSEGLKADPGDIVVCEITAEGPLPDPVPVVISENLGNRESKDIEIEIAVRKFNLPHQFSVDTIEEAERLPDEVGKAQLKRRVDLRDIPFVTIDGPDAKDFDDAVYCCLGEERNTYRLLVAIADVSEYVRPESPLDTDAQERSTSVYFPTKVIPMLPEKLSNGLCSLNPDVDRLTMVCDAIVTFEGKVTAYQFYPAVIHSAARLTYDSVWAALQNNKGPEALSMAHVLDDVKNLYELFKILLKSRQLRNALDFETIETYVVANDSGKIEKILPRERNDAHRLIEELMLVANTCAADFISSEKALCLYRIHEPPSEDKLEKARAVLSKAGLSLGGGEEPTPADYCEVLNQLKGRPDENALQTVLLRSMQRAEYSPDNVGHFGLNYPAYTHFTSPIRRYPDLLVHRTIKSLLVGKKKYRPKVLTEVPQDYPIHTEAQEEKKGSGKSSAQQRDKKAWKDLGIICSAHERRADDASFDVMAWLKCHYMKQFIGQTFEGVITGVAPFAIFITLNDVYVEGSVHVSKLPDYFEYDDALGELVGSDTGIVLSMGKELKVRIASVDEENRRIDMDIVSQLKPQKRRRR
ncbi:MAG: ribonuclease R [Burkholderiales bacterium]|nr:ribonuclease R [Burkholderiales bacterium]